MNYLSKTIKHFALVNKHRWYVFKQCAKLGLIWRGLLHDLSKFSPTEFWESVKYYNGNKSPITFCKKENGFSKAWLHHKGRNKHHPEYWYDYSLPKQTIKMPFVYVCEMVCDQLGAGKAYQGKNWTKEYQLEYFLRTKDKVPYDDGIANFLLEVYTQVAKDGEKKVVTKKNLKELYNKHVINDKKV